MRGKRRDPARRDACVAHVNGRFPRFDDGLDPFGLWRVTVLPLNLASMKRGKKAAGRAAAPATIRDVASELGMSVATVSRALSQPELLRPETRERVLSVVAKLGYRPFSRRIAWERRASGHS